ncbi:hypothetical protein VCHA53O466_40331 [Vibrio chagasii]|nr:hypothetical protein VCHA53O466_40331 [Vibrio chagasii]
MSKKLSKIALKYGITIDDNTEDKAVEKSLSKTKLLKIKNITSDIPVSLEAINEHLDSIEYVLNEAVSELSAGDSHNENEDSLEYLQLVIEKHRDVTLAVTGLTKTLK